MEYAGEGDDYPKPFSIKPTKLSHFSYKERLKEKKLSLDEASKALSMLGKNANGRYSYLKMSAIGMNLTDVSVILSFKLVMFVDLSKNLLKLDDIQVLCCLPFLTSLKADQNLLDSAALKSAPYLQTLLFNTNLITETCDIIQSGLEVLELGNNLIYTLQFDKEGLANLMELSLHGNHVIDTSGSFPPMLEKLYLTGNKISKINTDFSMIPNLKVLHLRQNNIKKLSGLDGNLVNLTYLNLRSNNISKMREFKKLEELPKLDTLIVLDNPIENPKEEVEEEDYEDVADENSIDERKVRDEETIRISLLALLPRLKRINKAYVTFEESEQADLSKKRILREIMEDESSEEEAELATENTTEYTSETAVTREGEQSLRSDENLSFRRYIGGDEATPELKSIVSFSDNVK